MFMLRSTHEAALKKAVLLAKEDVRTRIDLETCALRTQIRTWNTEYRALSGLLEAAETKAAKYDKLRADENSRNRAKRATKASKQVAK
jgi:hypothetical protein